VETRRGHHAVEPPLHGVGRWFAAIGSVKGPLVAGRRWSTCWRRFCYWKT